MQRFLSSLLFALRIRINIVSCVTRSSLDCLRIRLKEGGIILQKGGIHPESVPWGVWLGAIISCQVCLLVGRIANSLSENIEILPFL